MSRHGRARPRRCGRRLGRVRPRVVRHPGLIQRFCVHAARGFTPWEDQSTQDPLHELWSKAKAMGLPPLHAAIRLGLCHLVPELLRRARVPQAVVTTLAPDTNNAHTALHEAAKLGCEECTRHLLLAPAASVASATAPDVPTPLHLAAAGGHLFCMALLLKHGADMEARRGRCDATPWDSAALHGMLDPLLLLTSRRCAMRFISLVVHYQSKPLLNELESGLLESCLLFYRSPDDPAAIASCNHVMQLAITWSRRARATGADYRAHLPAFALLLKKLTVDYEIANKCILLPSLLTECFGLFAKFMEEAVYATRSSSNHDALELDFLRGVCFGFCTALLFNACMLKRERNQAASQPCSAQLQRTLQQLASFLNGPAWAGWGRHWNGRLVHTDFCREVEGLLTTSVLFCVDWGLQQQPPLCEPLLLANVRRLLRRHAGNICTTTAAASTVAQACIWCTVCPDPCGFDQALMVLVLLLPTLMDMLAAKPCGDTSTILTVLVVPALRRMVDSMSCSRRVAHAVIAILLPCLPQLPEELASSFEPCLRVSFAPAGLAHLEAALVDRLQQVTAVPAALSLTDLFVDLGMPGCHYHRCYRWPHQQQEEAQPSGGFMLCRDCLKARFCSEKCAREAWAWGHHHASSS